MNLFKTRKSNVLLITLAMVMTFCHEDEDPLPIADPDPNEPLYRIAVVVHVIHIGEPEGEGTNLSRERIEEQIRILNEDFRRKPGTPGFNDHPAGGDSRIEFFLATETPDGQPTDGIVRINRNLFENPISDNLFNHYAWYSYWDYTRYLNIWTQPLPEFYTDVVLGVATGPETDLPGGHLFQKGEPFQAEGIVINAAHFGASDISSNYNMGRTLTHEVGHYLGLLHLWGKGDCENNDYCDDTPPVSGHTIGCPETPPLACDGSFAMTSNYMDWTFDRCMNLFTKDQIARMHYVLENSPARKILNRKK